MCGGETQINQTAAAPQHATVDVAKLARWMTEKLDGLDDGRRRPQPKIRPSIYRVIPSVRQTDSSAYDPKIVSIGPFHRDNEGLSAMEEVKWRYLHDLLARCHPETNLHDSVAAVSALIREIRGQYSEEFGDIEDNRFVEMMVLDGCFILELMIKLYREGEDSVSASLPGGKWALPRLLNDLMLVENQIPFLVLETLFEAMAPNTFHSTVAELAFSSYVVPNRLPPEKMPDSQFLHLLHMIHYCHLFYLDDEESPVASMCSWQATYQRLLATGIKKVFYAVFQVCFRLFYLVVSCLVCSSPRSCRSSKKRTSRFGDVIPSATKLEEAGIRFKRKEYPGSLGPDPREVTFSDGIFQIPYMMLDLASNSQMRNFVAFEQCCRDLPNVGEYFTSYCILMALLLDKESDVDILIENGIIFNFALRPDEVASLFDNACSGVAPEFRDDKYSTVLANVSRYLHSDIHRWRAKLMHDYFANPWAIVSLAAAVALLVLTFLQTVYTIYAYYHPR